MGPGAGCPVLNRLIRLLRWPFGFIPQGGGYVVECRERLQDETLEQTSPNLLGCSPPCHSGAEIDAKVRGRRGTNLRFMIIYHVNYLLHESLSKFGSFLPIRENPPLHAVRQFQKASAPSRCRSRCLSRREVGCPVNIVKLIQPVLENKKPENKPILPGQIYNIV